MDCFQFLVIVTKAAVNVFVLVYLWENVFLFVGNGHLGSGVTRRNGRCIFKFHKKLNPFLTAVLFCAPSSNLGERWLLRGSVRLWHCPSNFSHFSRCVLVLIVVLICIFPWSLTMLRTFQYDNWSFVYLPLWSVSCFAYTVTILVHFNI